MIDPAHCPEPNSLCTECKLASQCGPQEVQKPKSRSKFKLPNWLRNATPAVKHAYIRELLAE